MGYGRSVPEGSLAVFSVNTEKEAEALIVLTCPLSIEGDYYAPELAKDQTLENLRAFGDRLATAYEFMEVNTDDKR